MISNKIGLLKVMQEGGSISQRKEDETDRRCFFGTSVGLTFLGCSPVLATTSAYATSTLTKMSALRMLAQKAEAPSLPSSDAVRVDDVTPSTTK